MAAEVGRQVKSDGKPGPGDPITRDFLGGCLGIEFETKELDLDLHVPTGWEKRLDLQSGEVYIQRCISPSSTPDQKTTNPTSQTTPNLDLKLFSDSPFNDLTIHGNATYQSVCTLEKVKSALDRARRVSSSSKKRPSPSKSDSSMISITKKNEDSSSNYPSSSDCFRTDNEESDENPMMAVGACPGCLLYVLISKTNPKCPKCNSVISLPTKSKKPRIDLNIRMCLM